MQSLENTDLLKLRQQLYNLLAKRVDETESQPYSVQLLSNGSVVITKEDELSSLSQ